MKKKKSKIIALFFVIGLLVFISSSKSIAGEDFQRRMQQKINAPTNIQFEQHGPYYSSGGKGEVQLDAWDIEEKAVDKPKEIRKERLTGTLAVASPVISSYAIYKTCYKSEMEENVVTIRGNILFEVFKKGWTQIPLVGSNVGLIDVAINKGASYVIMQGGKYYLMIDKPGRYNLDIEFLIKASREREGGPGSFNFEVMSAPISQFEFTMPETGVEIFVEPSIKTEIKREPKRTVAWAIMPNTQTITVRWTKALPKEEIAPVKLEPKVYADTTTYASVGEGLIRCQTNLNYSVLQSEISNLRIALPEDVSVLDVQGRDLRDWKVSNKESLQYLDVYLNFGVKGNYILSLSYERKIGEGSVVAQVPWVRVIGVEREKGYFGLAAATNVELAVNKIEHVTAIDVKELPASIWSSTASPILLAFKYLAHPFSIAIDVTRHEELPVLVAAIDSVDYVTLHTDEGKSLTKAVYQVRNNVKQFIHLVLPKNATLWSAFVAGKPVKPAKDKKGDILIPLEKSQLQGEILTQFPVEIVYLDQNTKMRLLGRLKLDLPQTDIPISSLNWSVYLPLDYAYFNFGGDIKPIRRGGYLPSPLGAVVSMQKALTSSVQYEQRMEQFAPGITYQDIDSARTKGILPIKIDIPQQGRLYRFSKLLVTEKESPWLSTNFITVFRQVHGPIRFLILIIIVFFVGIFIKKRLFKHKI